MRTDSKATKDDSREQVQGKRERMRQGINEVSSVQTGEVRTLDWQNSVPNHLDFVLPKPCF